MSQPRTKRDYTVPLDVIEKRIQQEQRAKTSFTNSLIALGISAAVLLIVVAVMIYRAQPDAAALAQNSVDKPNDSSAAVNFDASFDAEAVTINHAANKLEIRGTLKNLGKTAPPKIWVWAYFYAPTAAANSSWAIEPIEINQPFQNGKNELKIVVTGRCDWCDDSTTPKNGLYGVIKTSIVSAAAAELPEEKRLRSGGLPAETVE